MLTASACWKKTQRLLVTDEETERATRTHIDAEDLQIGLWILASDCTNQHLVYELKNSLKLQEIRRFHDVEKGAKRKLAQVLF